MSRWTVSHSSARHTSGDGGGILVDYATAAISDIVVRDDAAAGLSCLYLSLALKNASE